MSFGMTNAPSTFVTLMNTAFKKVSWGLRGCVPGQPHYIANTVRNILNTCATYSPFSESTSCMPSPQSVNSSKTNSSSLAAWSLPPVSNQILLSSTLSAACLLLKTFLNCAPSWEWLPMSSTTSPTVQSWQPHSLS